MRRSRHRYGGHRSQVGDLWLPADVSQRGVPVVMLVHGGYWRSIYTKLLMNGLARAVVGRGWAAWNIEYRRVGPGGGGGGWPATFCDVRAAVEYVAQLPEVDPTRLVTCGHSVGGGLALWAATEQSCAARYAMSQRENGESQSRVRPRAALSLAGVTDLQRAYDLGLGNGAVARFLGGSPVDHPERYAEGSPAALLPLGVPQVLIHGTSDTVVPPSMSRDYQRGASEAGDDAVFIPVEGLGHRAMIDRRAEGWSAISTQLDRVLSL